MTARRRPLPTGREALDEQSAELPRHEDVRDGCGGRASKVELVSGIEGAISRPVRKIVVLDG